MNAILMDQIDMPDYNPEANKGRGEWGLRDVSEGNVFADPVAVARCIDHGAMNSVSPSGTLWRCLACGRAAYRPSSRDGVVRLHWINREIDALVAELSVNVETRVRAAGFILPAPAVRRQS